MVAGTEPSSKNHRDVMASAPTELYGAAFYGDALLTKELLAAGADPCMRDDDGDTALHAAALHGAQLCKMYFQYAAEDGGDAEMFDLPDGADPTAGAELLPGEGKYVEVVQLLLEAGADPRAMNIDGVTPLHLAALWDNAEEAALLLRAGADANAMDLDGRTPLHLAAEGDARATASLLLATGADPSAKDFAGRTALDLSEDTDVRHLLTPKRTPWAGITAVALPITVLALYTVVSL